ncbi:MAG TPA: GTPase Era [Kosmotogaceae bacterium]|nr:MAG: GTPase Era [Thermotogales bacterium 46_20]HAA85343.1 GTPase Era [Kosmotogaceae bacterium]
MEDNYKAGTVTLVGRTNVGKSSLLNRMIGEKVAIVSDKPQTTRNRIAGILTNERFQAVIYDTPGIHKPLHRLGEYLVRVASAALSGVDLVVVIVDASERLTLQDKRVASLIERSSSPFLLALNKIDLCRDNKRLEDLLTDCRFQFASAQGIYQISAITGEGVDDLLTGIEGFLPKGPPLFPEDIVSDKPLKFMIAEIVREKILQTTREEVPHSCGIYLQQLEYRDDGTLYVLADIVVERESQKPIIIGKGGRQIKEIGVEARRDIEYLTDLKVFLELFVKVRKNWREKDSMIQEYTGLRDEIS